MVEIKFVVYLQTNHLQVVFKKEIFLKVVLNVTDKSINRNIKSTNTDYINWVTDKNYICFHFTKLVLRARSSVRKLHTREEKYENGGGELVCKYENGGGNYCFFFFNN